MTNNKIKRALISVYYKDGLEDLVRYLHSQEVEILSTDGTARAIKALGIPVTDVSDYTGFDEMMGGRVKTLHPKVHGGILNVRDNPEHRASMEKAGIKDIDLVVVNFYPFQKTIDDGGTHEEIIENIDIGGPAGARSGAKNHEDVTVITDQEDYTTVVEEMKANDRATTLEYRQLMAGKAFALTGKYDTAIDAYFQELNKPILKRRATAENIEGNTL